MAYQAKKGETFSKIANRLMVSEVDLRASNKGVRTLKTGQVINTPPVFSGNAIGAGVRRVVPKLPTIDTPFGSLWQPQALPQTTPQVSIPSSHALNVNNPSWANFAAAALNSPNNTNAFAGSSIGSGYGTGARDPQPKPPLNGQQSQGTPSILRGQQSTLPPLNGQQSVAGQPYTGTAGYYANYNQQNSPYLGASSYLNPAFQQGQPASPAAASPKLIPPTNASGKPILYTGDPKDPNTAKWIAYWNDAAAHPDLYAGEPTAPKVMTHAEIWEMKAASRRKKAEQSAGDEVSYQGAGYVPSDPQNIYVYPDAIRNIVWGG